MISSYACCYPLAILTFTSCAMHEIKVIINQKLFLMYIYDFICVCVLSPNPIINQVPALPGKLKVAILGGAK